MGLIALLVAGAALAGCGNGGGVSGDAIAEVDGTAIEQSDFERQLAVAAKSGGEDATVPDPPDFEDCVAQLEKATAQGQPKQTDADYKKQCQQQYDQLREQVVSLLISFEWLEGEAEEQGIEVTDAQVQKEFEEQKKQAFPKDADYQQFLKDSGQSNDDVLRGVRLKLISDAIRDKVTKGKGEVTDQQIEDYYDKNKAQFAQPERRDLSIVLTKTEAKANEAKAALQSGESFKSVAKEFSIDDASKAKGGKLPAVAKGQQEKTFDDAIFKARKDKIAGPVKTQFGWYVFRVDKVTEPAEQTLEQAKTTIKQVLASQSQQKALDAFVEDFRKRWREKTECREGYLTPDCKNGPDPTPTPTPPAGGEGAPAPQPTP